MTNYTRNYDPNYKQITAAEAAKLKSAGVSSQFMPAEGIGIRHDGSLGLVRVEVSLENVLDYLHLQAQKGQQSLGDNIADIAGFVLLTEEEVKARLGDHANKVSQGKEGKFFGAEYFYKEGRGPKD